MAFDRSFYIKEIVDNAKDKVSQEAQDKMESVLEDLKQDLENVRAMHRDTKKKLKEFKEKYNG